MVFVIQGIVDASRQSPTTVTQYWMLHTTASSLGFAQDTRLLVILVIGTVRQWWSPCLLVINLRAHTFRLTSDGKHTRGIKLRKICSQRNNKDSPGWVNWERGRWYWAISKNRCRLRSVLHPVCGDHLEPALNQCRWCHLHTYTGNLSQDIVQCHIKYRSLCCQKTLVCDIGQCHTINCPGSKFKEESNCL